jgi:hypothetical protein
MPVAAAAGLHSVPTGSAAASAAVLLGVVAFGVGADAEADATASGGAVANLAPVLVVPQSFVAECVAGPLGVRRPV